MESLRSETMPSRPSLQALAKTVGPSPSICSLNRMPGRLGHDIRERGLADLKRIAPQIVAVQVACFVMPGALPFPEPVPLWEPETYSATASRYQSVFRGVAFVCRNG